MYIDRQTNGMADGGTDGHIWIIYTLSNGNKEKYVSERVSLLFFACMV
jgi:hypothetical protein